MNNKTNSQTQATASSVIDTNTSTHAKPSSSSTLKNNTLSSSNDFNLSPSIPSFVLNNKTNSQTQATTSSVIDTNTSSSSSISNNLTQSSNIFNLTQTSSSSSTQYVEPAPDYIPVPKFVNTFVDSLEITRKMYVVYDFMNK